MPENFGVHMIERAVGEPRPASCNPNTTDWRRTCGDAAERFSEKGIRDDAQ